MPCTHGPADDLLAVSRPPWLGLADRRWRSWLIAISQGRTGAIGAGHAATLLE